MEDDGCQSAFLNGEPISKVSIASDTIFKEKKVVQSDRYQTSHLSAAKKFGKCSKQSDTTSKEIDDSRENRID